MLDETQFSAIDLNLARALELSPDVQVILRDGAQSAFKTLTQADQDWTVEIDSDGAVTVLALDTVLSDDELEKVGSFIYYKSASRADIYGNGTRVPWKLESDRVVRLKAYKATQKYTPPVAPSSGQAGMRTGLLMPPTYAS